MRNKKGTGSSGSNGFSKEFMEEFGLIPSGKQKLEDKVGKLDEYENNHNTPQLVDEYLAQHGLLPSDGEPPINKNS